MIRVTGGHDLVWKNRCLVSLLENHMAEIIEMPLARARRAGVRKPNRRPVHTDMTPMVDLGFLLISFFIMTAQLSKPASLRLAMPKESPESPMLLDSRNALTVLLDAQARIYYYEGSWEDAKKGGDIISTSMDEKTGLGKLIREKQQALDLQGTREGRSGLMLLVKAGKNSEYRQVVDALDECIINQVKKYAVLRADQDEEKWMRDKMISGETR